ncbi:unnamed protein product [Rotaria sp. Silwood1]|nr:unnamed protein product [Rotaria sp. Silwood1]
MIQVRIWKRHILKTHYSKISQEYTGHNDSRIAVNTSHSTYEEADIDSNAHTATDENIIFNHQGYATTNSTDPVPVYTNDLSHGNIQMLSKIEERLRLNILRLLINLKNNNATETCIEICSRDLINVLNEYKDLDKPEVYESLDCRSRSRIMTDLSTGSFCEQHNLFKIPDSLKIILFYDDLGINNPLGSRAKSVGMFYWTLANLPSDFDIFQQTGIDIIHVLLEGICQRELKLLFKHIHPQKFSNLLSLASMIRNFQYGSKESSASNTFNLSSEDNEVKFRASASEMLVLFKYIPNIFYQARLIELLSTSLCWLSFLLLREILSISFASEIGMMTIEKLEKLVTHYLLTFDNAYSYAQRIPKHHLIKYRNFRNIAYTLADRHQHYIACLMYTCYNANTSSFLYSGHQIKKIKELYSTAAKQHHLLDTYKNLYETNQVTLFGITYTIGNAVLINDCVFSSDPVFGKILTIIVQDEIMLFRLQLMQVIMFKQQLCLYELRLLDSSVTKNIYELKHKYLMQQCLFECTPMFFQMSFLFTGLVQFGDETEMVDIYVGSSLADVHAQLEAPFDLDPNQCIIQVDLSKVQNTPTSSHRSQALSDVESVSPICLNPTNLPSNHFDSSQDSLSVSYKDHLDQMSSDNENHSSQVESFNSVEPSVKCQRDSKGKRDLDNLRELPPLPLSHMLPSFPIQIKSAIASGNDLLIRKLFRRIRDLRSQIKRNSYKRPRFLDWDSNRYTENVSQTDSPVIDPTAITDSSQLKEFITKLNDAFDNNQMTKGTTTQIIVESFRLRRCYLQLGQSMQQILNEMLFSQHIAFIKLEFELITKVSLLVATQRIRKFLDNIVSYEMYGQLPDDHVCTTSIKPGTI